MAHWETPEDASSEQESDEKEDHKVRFASVHRCSGQHYYASWRDCYAGREHSGACGPFDTEHDAEEFCKSQLDQRKERYNGSTTE
jgi:hypothetical protein